MRRHFERPILRAVLPGAFMIIFLICTTSFAVALILGGGPRATTVELAIYQAFRFEFDLGRAAMLGLVQAAICVAAGLLGSGLMRGGEMGAGWTVRRWHGPGIRFGRGLSMARRSSGRGRS
jgi:thiamine transport system permease protein